MNVYLFYLLLLKQCSSADIPKCRYVRAESKHEQPTLDDTCGAMALFFLSHNEGYKVQYEDLRSILGPPTIRGHSLANLADAGRHYGLRLQGVRIRRDRAQFDHPAILYFRAYPKSRFMPLFGS